MEIIINKTQEKVVIENWVIENGKIFINNKSYYLQQRDKLLFNCKQCNKSIITTSKLNKFIDSQFLCKNCQAEQTCQKNYGVKRPLQNKNIYNKQQQTTKQRHPIIIRKKKIKVKRTKEESNILRKQTCKEKYGTNTSSENAIVKEKIKQSHLNRPKEEVQESNKKRKETNEQKWGHENAGSNPLIIEKIKRIKFNNQYNKIKNRLEIYNIEPLFNIEDYQGNKNGFSGIKYLWKCIKCGNEFEDDIANGTIPRCTKCLPLITGNSNLEKEIISWLYNLTILRLKEKERSLIHPKELDIYLPDHKIAIEFNGLYWHSEIANKKDKNYHLNKTNSCKAQDIQLLQIFEDEWLNKQSIVKSIIKAKLNLYDQTIYARKCQIIKITDIKLVRSFLNENHLQGYIYSKQNYGLYYNNELISLACFTPKKDYYEMTRFCNKLNYKVIGGFSRLLKSFEREFNNPKIKTFADLRYSIGNVYLKNGFILDHISLPNYFYTKDYKNRLSRIQFQKHKLSKKLEFYDETLTEWENMQLNGYDRIFDCGNLVFIKN